MCCKAIEHVKTNQRNKRTLINVRQCLSSKLYPFTPEVRHGSAIEHRIDYRDQNDPQEKDWNMVRT